MDALSLARIATGHPDIRNLLTLVFGECEAALTGRAKVRLTFVFRTDLEQDGLYALGRTKVNPDGKSAQRPFGYKVTNAPGGSSIHNYGLAVDIALIIDGKTASWNDLPDYDGDKVSDWMECVRIFKKHGFTWGGDWSSFVDKPHFQYTFGLTLSQLKAKRVAKDFIPGTKFVNLQHSATNEYKTISGLNMRSGAGGEFPVVRVLPIGTRVLVLCNSGEWSSISFGPFMGWVSSKYLKKA